MNPFDTQYNPSDIEQKWYEFWLKEKLFTPTNEKPHKENFCLILPPPNVTGVLHMGHALTCTLEDIIIRRKRMQGYNTLWLPGTDHAGIATQMVVERNLQKTEKKSRHDLGREAFLKKVWEWKEISQNTIHSQLKLIGCSIDWSRLRFTMDEQSSYAVRFAFKKLLEEGLIYRGTSINQWCPRCLTVLSDLEVKHKESKGKIWQLLYRFSENSKEGLIVATTRPETLFGDVAVAVNPKDDRYKQYIGKTVLLPITNRKISIIADEYVDKEFGTGALKITPAHDVNDYQIGLKHNMPQIKQPKGANRKTNTQKSENYNHHEIGGNDNTGLRYPKQVLEFNTVERGIHPTQKPVALFEYLIRTYTNEGELVLDNCAGSGTTAIAAENTGRKWVCIEQLEEYATKAVERIQNHQLEEKPTNEVKIDSDIPVPKGEDKPKEPTQNV
jgi:valyl-tRNA synthetase